MATKQPAEWLYNCFGGIKGGEARGYYLISRTLRTESASFLGDLPVMPADPAYALVG